MFPLLLLAGLGAFVVLSRSSKPEAEKKQEQASLAERALTESASDSGITYDATRFTGSPFETGITIAATETAQASPDLAPSSGITLATTQTTQESAPIEYAPSGGLRAVTDKRATIV